MSPMNPNLYGNPYINQNQSMQFNQFQSHYNPSGMFINPMNQFAGQPGKLFLFYNLKNMDILPREKKLV